MKQLVRIIYILTTIAVLALPGYATVYLDDTWADGTRNNQALPTNSAWFCSTGASLTSSSGSMNLAVGSGAIAALTYFTTNDTSPVHLDVGDTLVTTIKLSFSGVAAQNSSQGFRLGIFNFADSSLSPKRVTGDGLGGNNTQGSGVQGYSIFQNMGATFNNSNPMDIRKRTNLSSSALLGTSGDHTSLATGPGDVSLFPGFGSGTNYVLEFTFQRTGASSLAITISWLNPTNGATLTTSFTDTGATNFNFDGIALRPSGSGSTASTITFHEVKVEFAPGATAPSIEADPDDQSVLVGQNASFNVQASGTTPLSYQWYYNTNSVLTNATSSSLTLTNVQLSDTGLYSALVSNAYGSVTSAVGQLTVSAPVAPSILTQPQDQTNILPGASATFTVSASGSAPLSYQWYYNTSTPVANGNDPILTITNVQPANAGNYSVVVSNVAGAATSSNAVLTVNTSPVAPSFASQPASQVVLIGGTASFSAVAAGTAPISYQWSKDGEAVAGGTSSTLTLTNVQNADAGVYSVTASNSVGDATSDPAVLTVTAAIPVVNSAYNLVGFGQGTTGGGVIPETDPAYAKVYTALDLANAIRSANKTAGSVKVIEIMNDLDLGWNEIGATAQGLDSNPFREVGNTPLLHPHLQTTSVSVIDIKSKSGLTIFSANGATLRHANLNIKGTANIIIRNLKFDELWEWDEDGKGEYDRNDYDFITLGNGGGTVSNVWIDHCTFTKSYDGTCDIKGGANHITFSWNKYAGDDGATNMNSWVWQQINKLESNQTAYAMYNAIRNSGLSATDIVTIVQGHQKTHLMGANPMNSENDDLSATFHHQWYINPWDRLPRLRGGNVHNYNIYVDDTLALAAQRLRDQHSIPSTYNFRPPLNGSISTEDGAVLVEKSVYIDCRWPLRNNQTDISNPAYTGKIKALDTIYQFDSTVVRGDSTDPGNPLGPFQAPVIAFSWNLPGNVLPYSYSMDDPSQLQTILTSPTAGAGAGVLTWNKTNWLVTSYPATAPTISVQPNSAVVTNGQSVNFSVVAYGSVPLSYRWYFNTNSPVANATNTALTIASVQPSDLGTYSVVVSNSAGTTASAFATLSISSPSTPFEDWQMFFFGCIECPQADPSADPDGDGMNNEAEFLSGTNPIDSTSALRVISAARQGADVVISWTAGAGRTNVVQATAGDANGSYSTNFFNLSDLIVIPTNDVDVVTNYVDVAGATNSPARYYRIRLVP